MKMEIEQLHEFGIGALKSKLLENIHKYLEGGDMRAHFVNVETSDLHTFETLLDPRYKGCFFQKKMNAERAKQRLKYLAKYVLGLRNFEAADPTQNTFDSVDEIEKENRSNSLSWEEYVLSGDDEDVHLDGISESRRNLLTISQNAKEYPLMGNVLSFGK